jgi:hypothetical protein
MNNRISVAVGGKNFPVRRQSPSGSLVKKREEKHLGKQQSSKGKIRTLCHHEVVSLSLSFGARVFLKIITFFFICENCSNNTKQ